MKEEDKDEERIERKGTVVVNIYAYRFSSISEESNEHAE